MLPSLPTQSFLKINFVFLVAQNRLVLVKLNRVLKTYRKMRFLFFEAWYREVVRGTFVIEGLCCLREEPKQRDFKNK